MKNTFRQTHMLLEAQKSQKGFAWGLEILIFLLVFFVTQFIQAIPVGISLICWIFTSNSVMDILIHGDVNTSINVISQLVTNIPDWIMLVQLFSTMICTVLTVLFCRLIEKRPLSSLGLRRGHILHEYLLGAVIGSAMISLCVGLCAVFGGLTLRSSSFSITIWLLYLLGFLIQGMSEEVLCRGYMMVSVSRKK